MLREDKQCDREKCQTGATKDGTWLSLLVGQSGESEHAKRGEGEGKFGPAIASLPDSTTTPSDKRHLVTES